MNCCPKFMASGIDVDAETPCRSSAASALVRLRAFVVPIVNRSLRASRHVARDMLRRPDDDDDARGEARIRRPTSRPENNIPRGCRTGRRRRGCSDRSRHFGSPMTRRLLYNTKDHSCEARMNCKGPARQEFDLRIQRPFEVL